MGSGRLGGGDVWELRYTSSPQLVKWYTALYGASKVMQKAHYNKIVTELIGTCNGQLQNCCKMSRKTPEKAKG